jgi:hypothetical protein
MYQPRRKHNTGRLYALLFLAGIYGVVLHFRRSFTGSLVLDGSIGVVFGLFICSRGAANLLDVILFGRYQNQLLSKQAQAWWLALNILILVVGWTVIVTGTTQFTSLAAAGLHAGGAGR